MKVNLSIVLGTVNYTDYLRVSISKVSDPSIEVQVKYIDVPVSNYTITFNDIDPATYYVRFRDAPNNSSLGTLISECLVEANSNEYEFEMKFYEIGALPDGVTISGDMKTLTDPYFDGKLIYSTFKEGYRPLQPVSEYTVTGTSLTLINTVFSNGEKFVVQLKNKVTGAGSSVSTGSIGVIFKDTISVTGTSYSIAASDAGKRFLLNSIGNTQIVNLPALSTLANGDTFYFEHKKDGLQKQTKILFNGMDKLFFNGFNAGSNLLSEIWVGKGESLFLQKNANDWDLIFDYKGTNIGERFAATHREHPNTIMDDGNIYDGDEYPRLWWWINNVIHAGTKIIDDNVTSPTYSWPAGKQGLFVIHSTLKKFRTPNFQGLSEKGMKNFTSYGSDSDRIYDYPGGFQDQQVSQHSHKMFSTGSGGTPFISKEAGLGGNSSYNMQTSNIPPSIGDNEIVGGENRVKNLGVVFLRRV